MDRLLRGRWGASLAAAVALAAAAGPAAANETVYNEDGYKLVVGIHAGFGVFSAGNVDFGAGNVDSRAPLEGPFASAQRRTQRNWYEAYAKAFAEIETPFFGFGHTYAVVSVDGTVTRGSGDALSSLASQGARSTTSDNPQDAELEDYVVGWHSGDLLKESLGEDALDLSAGRQSFVVGDAFLIGSGVVNGFGRAAFTLQPHTSFDHAAILKVNSAPVRVQLFNLETRSDQDLMRGFDQPKAKIAGFDLALFKSGEALSEKKAAGEKEANQAAQETAAARDIKETRDVWTAGITFFHIYDADSTPGPFSFPVGAPSPTLSVNGNRNGLNVISGYLQGSFLESNPDILLFSQFVLESNDDPNRRVDANAWYLEPGYRFSTLPWTPQVNLRYAHFSGDPNPLDRTKQSYDPLFSASGDRGFGSWTQGEIFGGLISPNSNLNVEMVHIKATPLPDLLDIGAIFYSFEFDHPGQFNDPRITAHHAADELDLYAKWSPDEWLGFTGVVGFAVPGAGLKQAAHAFVADNGPPGRPTGRAETLAELILEIKY